MGPGERLFILMNLDKLWCLSALSLPTLVLSRNEKYHHFTIYVGTVTHLVFIVTYTNPTIQPTNILAK